MSIERNESNEEKAARLAWWREARFGMFVHWGIYSLAARHEWVKNFEEISAEEYGKYFDHFDPDLHDPREWARAARSAGMKYFVITSKHHDGFCLWDSKFTDYDVIDATPFKRDILGELAEECKKQEIRL